MDDVIRSCEINLAGKNPNDSILKKQKQNIGDGRKGHCSYWCPLQILSSPLHSDLQAGARVCVRSCVPLVEWNYNVWDERGNAGQLLCISRAEVLAQLNGPWDDTAAGSRLWLMMSLGLSQCPEVSVCLCNEPRRGCGGRSHDSTVLCVLM